jgi:hypothetical protein
MQDETDGGGKGYARYNASMSKTTGEGDQVQKQQQKTANGK